MIQAIGLYLFRIMFHLHNYFSTASVSVALPVQMLWVYHFNRVSTFYHPGFLHSSAATTYPAITKPFAICCSLVFISFLTSQQISVTLRQPHLLSSDNAIMHTRYFWFVSVSSKGSSLKLMKFYTTPIMVVAHYSSYYCLKVSQSLFWFIHPLRHFYLTYLLGKNRK